MDAGRVVGRSGMSIGRSLIRDGVVLGGGPWRRGRGMGRSIGRVPSLCHAWLTLCIMIKSEAFGRRKGKGRVRSWTEGMSG